MHCWPGPVAGLGAAVAGLLAGPAAVVLRLRRLRAVRSAAACCRGGCMCRAAASGLRRRRLGWGLARALRGCRLPTSRRDEPPARTGQRLAHRPLADARRPAGRGRRRWRWPSGQPIGAASRASIPQAAGRLPEAGLLARDPRGLRAALGLAGLIVGWVGGGHRMPARGSAGPSCPASSRRRASRHRARSLDHAAGLYRAAADLFRHGRKPSVRGERQAGAWCRPARPCWCRSMAAGACRT